MTKTHPQITPSQLYRDLQAVREQSPLIHNITNLVVMQTNANMLLAIGASPIMAHAEDELAEILALANALVINIGTLDHHWLNSITVAQKIALSRGIPIIFDPVGAGASQFRTKTALKILENGVSVLRGNASEILSLVSESKSIKGVDSTHDSVESVDAAKTLSQRYECCVVVSGKTDVICYRDQIIFLRHGTPQLTQITGMGCSATAMIGAFASINSDLCIASSFAMATLGICAEIASNNSNGPGTFYIQLLDALSGLKEIDIDVIRHEVKHQ